MAAITVLQSVLREQPQTSFEKPNHGTRELHHNALQRHMLTPSKDAWAMLFPSFDLCESTSPSRGSYLHFRPRPCPSTYRWARLATHRRRPHSVGNPCSRSHLGRFSTACVSSTETGQSPLARTCSRTWVFLRRLHIQAHRFFLTLHTVHVTKPRSKKLAIISRDVTFLGTCFNASLTPRWAQAKITEVVALRGLQIDSR